MLRMLSWIWRNYSHLRLLQDCPTSVEVGKTKLPTLVLLRVQAERIRASIQLTTRRVSVVNIEVHFAEMTKDRFLTNERFYTSCKCCLSIFKNKASNHKQRQINWCYLSLFYMSSIISAFVTYIMYFIEAFARLRICLFRYVFTRFPFCRDLAKLVILAQF